MLCAVSNRVAFATVLTPPVQLSCAIGEDCVAHYRRVHDELLLTLCQKTSSDYVVERWETSAHLYADVTIAERACQIGITEKALSLQSVQHICLLFREYQ